jgi:sn-glycerol 3-phosphate transport system substrate-binding protein
MTFGRAGRALALLVVSMLWLTGCTDAPDDATDDEEPAAEPGPDDQVAEEATDDADPEATDDTGETATEVIDVPVWLAFTGGRLAWMQQLADVFNAEAEGYRITVEGLDAYGPLFEATRRAVEQGTPPAVVHSFDVATAETLAAGGEGGEALFTSIDAAVADRDEVLGVPVVIDDVIAAARRYYTVDGELRALPWNASSTIMFTNLTLLDDYEVEEVPATWDEIEDACETIMEADDPPDSCITWPNHAWFTEQAVSRQGALLADGDNGRSERATELELDGDAMVDWVSWWQELHEAGYYDYTGVQRDWTGSYNAFAAGQVPFLVYSSVDTVQLTAAAGEADFEVTTSPMPYNADRDEGGHHVGGGSLWLVAGLDPTVQDVALAFLNFLIAPVNAADWHQQTGYLPITNEALALLESDGWFDEHPDARTANEQLADAPDSPAAAGVVAGNWVAIRDVITDAVETVLTDDRDPAEALEDAQDAAQALLDDYNAS